MPQEAILEKKSGSIIDVELSLSAWRKWEEIYGPFQASQIALKVFADDFSSLAWEATKNPLPYRFFYRIIKEGGKVKLVHQEDLHSGKDILEGVNPNFRRGKERLAITKFRRELFDAPVGESRFLISSKRDENEPEKDCPYTNTQINIAQKLTDDLIMVHQFQSDNLDRKRSIQVFNLLTEGKRLGPKTSIDRLITSVGEHTGSISTHEVLANIGYLTGQRLSRFELQEYKRLEQETSERARFQAFRLLMAIRGGLRGRELKRFFGELLEDTVGTENLDFLRYTGYGREIMTSCGAITLGSNYRSYDRIPTMISTKEKYGKCGGCGDKKILVECGRCEECLEK